MVLAVDIVMILGVDPSWSGTGVVRSDGAGALLSAPKAEFSCRVERLDYLGGKLLPLARGCSLAVVEGYAMGSRTRPQQAGELSGHYRWLLWGLGIRVLIVPPKTVKKWATGNGNASKAQMIEHALERWAYKTDNDNMADAYIMYRLGESWAAGDRPNTLRGKIESIAGKRT